MLLPSLKSSLYMWKMYEKTIEIIYNKFIRLCVYKENQTYINNYV